MVRTFSGCQYFPCEWSKRTHDEPSLFLHITDRILMTKGLMILKGYIEIQNAGRAVLHDIEQGKEYRINISYDQYMYLKEMVSQNQFLISKTWKKIKGRENPTKQEVYNFNSAIMRKIKQCGVSLAEKENWFHVNVDCVFCDLEIREKENNSHVYSTKKSFFDGEYYAYTILTNGDLACGIMLVQNESKVALILPTTATICIEVSKKLAAQAIELHDHPIVQEGYRVFIGELHDLGVSYDALLAEDGIVSNRKYITFPKYNTASPKAIGILVPTLTPAHVFGQTGIPTSIEYFAVINSQYVVTADFENEISAFLGQIHSECIKEMDQQLYELVRKYTLSPKSI